MLPCVLPDHTTAIQLEHQILVYCVMSAASIKQEVSSCPDGRPFGGTIDMSQKVGAAVPLKRVELGPHPTQYGLG